MRRRVLLSAALLLLLSSHFGCGAGNVRPISVSSAATSASASTSASGEANSSGIPQTGSRNSGNSGQVTGYGGLNGNDGPAQPENASVLLVPNTVNEPIKYPATVSINIIGRNTEFAPGATRASFGPGVLVGQDAADMQEVGLLQVTGPNSATANISIDESAAPGPRTVVVITGGHPSLATFFVPPHKSGPVARATTRGFVSRGKTLYLDASGSTLLPASNLSPLNPAISPQLAFHWKLLCAPSASEASLHYADTVQPALVPDKEGFYAVQLNVDDGASSSSTWAVFSTRNSAPVADAGPDQRAAVGDVVRLDASRSSDMDGDALTYQWDLISAPAGSAALLSDGSAVSPTFTVDAEGDFKFGLTVDDGHGNTSNDILVVSTKGVLIADAGPPTKAALNQAVEFDGSASTGTSAINCTWQLLAAPVASVAQLSHPGPSPCDVKPGIIADRSGTYLAQLVVSNGAGAQAIGTTFASTDTMPPFADAGSSRTVAVGETVQLDGAKSTESDGHPLTYLWSLISKPSNSAATLLHAASVQPGLVPDREGDYVAQLVVSNGEFASRPSTVLLSAKSPHLQPTPAALTFTDQPENTTSASAPILVTNTGEGTLVVSDITIAGADASDFAYTSPALPVTLAAGETTTVNVTFTPTSPGTRTAALSLDSNAVSTALVTLTGITPTRPSRPTRVPVAQITPSSISFSDQLVNTTSSATTISITNPKSTPLLVSNLELVGTNASDFTFTPGTTTFTIPAQGSASLSVNFTPSAPSARTAALRVTDSAGSHDLSLTGTGVAPSVDPLAPVNFGDVNVNSTSSPVNVTITNSGTTPLHISALSFGGTNAGDFKTTTVTPIVVAANGGTANIAVTFTPTAAGTRTGTLLVTDDAAGSPHSAPLTGNGIGPLIALNPTSLTFPSTLTTTSSAPQTVTVTNNGNADLTISGLTIIGTNASDFTVAETAPITVSKIGGTASLTVTFKPTAAGTRTAKLQITNNSGNVVNNVTVDLTGTGRDRGRLSLQPATVGKDLELLAIGSVDVAPLTSLSITITSSDPSKLLLSPLATDSSGTNAGVASFVGTLAAGKGVNGLGFPAFWIQALASSGTAQITMTAPGYTTATATITFTPSGFVLISPLGIGTDFTTQLSAADSNLTVSTARLDTGGNVVITDQKLRGGLTTSVDVVSGTPATGTVTGTPVSFQGGTSSSASGAIKFHPVAIGTTQLSVTQPAGFTAPVSGTTLTATVRAPAITLTPSVVGYNLQVLGNGSLNIAAPAGGLQVTISSSDTTKLLLSTDPLVAGSGSVTVTVPAASTLLPTFYIQGLASSGTASITATATGYSSASANVLLSPSGFVLNSPGGGGNFTTTTLSAATDLTVSVWQLTSSFVPVVAGQFRGGATTAVTVVSGNTTTGTIVNGQGNFTAGNDTITGMSFQPNPNCVTPCTSVLSVSHTSDYATPVPGGQITATVNKPTVSLRVTQSTVGKNLQVLGSGALDVPAPIDLQVTITSNSPNVLLSASPTTMGSTSLTVTVPAGSGVNSFGFPDYYIQAVADSGTVQLTATAAGFNSSTLNVTLAPAGFVIEGPNGVGGNFGTVLANGNVDMTVRAAVLDPSNGLPTLLYEAVRGGFSATVNVTSSAPSVATLSGPPLTMSGGNGSGTVTLQPQAPGQTTITVATPAGYVTPSAGYGLTVTVN